jgi:hypothetical protein
MLRILLTPTATSSKCSQTSPATISTTSRVHTPRPAAGDGPVRTHPHLVRCISLCLHHFYSIASAFRKQSHHDEQVQSSEGGNSSPIITAPPTGQPIFSRCRATTSTPAAANPTDFALSQRLLCRVVPSGEGVMPRGDSQSHVTAPTSNDPRYQPEKSFQFAAFPAVGGERRRGDNGEGRLTGFPGFSFGGCLC